MTGCPSTRTSPAAGAASPLSRSSTVDLPQPLGPTRVEELAGLDLEVEAVEGDELVRRGPPVAADREDLADVVELDLAAIQPSSAYGLYSLV